MATAKQANNLTFVWGNTRKGIAIERSVRKTWNVVHIKNGKVVLVHRDYPTKGAAIREAKDYASYEQKHSRNGFFSFLK